MKPGVRPYFGEHSESYGTPYGMYRLFCLSLLHALLLHAVIFLNL